MKNYLIAVAIIACAVLAVALAESHYQNAVLVRNHHEYVRRTELDLADVKSRLETLERVGIEVTIKDKTNTWFVFDGKVQ